MTPSHYRHAIEPIEVMEMVAENPNIPRKTAMLAGQSIKYLLRLGWKGSNYLEDLDKAIDYLWRARHSAWLTTGEQDTPEKQMCRIRNLFRLSGEWYTAEEVSELLVVPLAYAWQLLNNMAASGLLTKSSNDNRTGKDTMAFKRLDK